MGEWLPPTGQGCELMGGEQRLTVDMPEGSASTGRARHLASDRSPILPTDAEYQSLLQTPWSAYLEFIFPEAVDVHESNIDVLASALEARPHLAVPLGRAIYLALAVEDDSADSMRTLDEVRHYLGTLIPNAVVTCRAVARSGLDLGVQPQRPSLHLIHSSTEGR